uniref:Uracil phosphoribosyltransferase n=1 Tax=Melanthalia intermedia TaxID=172989 RepID=A0A345UB11_9FLOR|nr:hypothetical protein [Melanthalia intermedia]AXI97647.1 hypothetical protein [Melanthalia intermedia]
MNNLIYTLIRRQMQLNIYVIIHPIIQRLANEIIYNYDKSRTNRMYDSNIKKLEILILYESIRKSIKGQNAYIKQIDLFKEKYLLDNKKKYLIVANLVTAYNIISEVNSLMPEKDIKHIDLKQILGKDNNKKSITNYLSSRNSINYRIIIFEKFLNKHTTIKILDYLTNKTSVKIGQVQVACIACNNKIIRQIGRKYSNLSIYTTKIREH